MSQFRLKIGDLKTVEKIAMPQILKEFQKNTPIRTGYARAHTFEEPSSIVADYPYATFLEQGRSKQAPRGMIEPTTEFVKRLIPQIVQQLGSRRNG